MHRRCLVAAVLAAAMSCATGSDGAVLYRCADEGGGVSYRREPCPAHDSRVLAIDRASTDIHPQRGGRASSSEASAATDRPSAEERRRVAPQRRAEGATPPRPRREPSVPAPTGRDRAPSQPFPPPPLGAVVPGTRGPLVASPAGPTSPGPAGVPGITDPATGRLLVPSGERLIDPLTGTMWMRAGRSYVDPLSGRTIPAP